MNVGFGYLHVGLGVRFESHSVLAARAGFQNTELRRISQAFHLRGSAAGAVPEVQ
jgi:hypothetical protein